MKWKWCLVKRGLGRPIFSARPAFRYGDLRLIPGRPPPQCQKFSSTQRGRCARYDQNTVKRVRQYLNDGKSLVRGNENRLVFGFRCVSTGSTGFLVTSSCRAPILYRFLSRILRPAGQMVSAFRIGLGGADRDRTLNFRGVCETQRQRRRRR